MTIVDLNSIEITNGRNVRYHGRALDKCAISNLIRDVALASGHSGYCLWSDIYWYSSTKKELVDYLREFIVKYRHKIFYNETKSNYHG